MTAKPKILYVDDEKDNLFAFRSVFRRFYNKVEIESVLNTA